uniref:Uncharacterized protein n=1 Tax=Aegilops tauschii TaxID=37682 RepID=M8BTJ1_AEGTA
MEHTRNGDLKVSYEQELFGRRRNGNLPAYPDLTREAIATGPARGGVPPKSTPSRRRTYADGELDVFSAERYFKGAIDGDSKEGSVTPVETLATVSRPAVPVSKPTSTCASAARAGSGGPGNPRNMRLPAVGREEKAGEYSSASFRKGSFTLQAPVKVSCGGGGDDDDDGGSESSSDLFEIKSLMIGDCPYEPSEASIQWSVVTASAVDMSAAPERGGGRGRPQVDVRQNRDRPVGLLTGCVSRRAVDVSPMAAVRRFPDPPGRRRIDG